MDNRRPSLEVDRPDRSMERETEGDRRGHRRGRRRRRRGRPHRRSVRASDPELLSQYGRVILVASGGGGDSLPTLDKSILHGVIMDRGGPGFSRDGSRSAPYNAMSNLAAVSSAVKADSAKSIGLQ